MTYNEKLYIFCILGLLIAIDEEVENWGEKPKLQSAVAIARRNTLDLSAFDDLHYLKREFEKELKNEH